MTDIHRQRLASFLPSLDLSRLRALMQEWWWRARSRREIAKLDERTLRDLGVSPSQMEFEARKPFWRA